jgi:hypothetical protein
MLIVLEDMIVKNARDYYMLIVLEDMIVKNARD